MPGADGAKVDLFIVTIVSCAAGEDLESLVWRVAVVQGASGGSLRSAVVQQPCVNSGCFILRVAAIPHSQYGVVCCFSGVCL